MQGVPHYSSNEYSVAPLIMMYFNPPTEFSTECELDVNHVTYFKNEINKIYGKKIGAKKIREIMMLPFVFQEESERLKMVCDGGEGSRGEVRPAHVPLLDDLVVGYSEVFIILLKNMMKRLQESDKHLVVPHYLKEVIDPKPLLDLTAPVYAIGNVPIRVCMASYTDAFQAIRFFSEDQVAEIKVFENMLRPRIHHGRGEYHSGRFHDIRINPKYSKNFFVKPCSIRSGTTIVCWNARGVARPSFHENFLALRAQYDASVFVITESRISSTNIHWVVALLGQGWDQHYYGQSGFEAGVVIFYDTTKLCVLDCRMKQDPWVASVIVEGLGRPKRSRQ